MILKPEVKRKKQNKEFKYMVVFYGQITSTVLLVILVWYGGDFTYVEKFFTKFNLNKILIQFFLTFIIMTLSWASFMVIFKKMLKNNKK